MITLSRRFELPELTKERDLIYYDGPLLSLFRDKKNNPYLYNWADQDDKYNRWIVFKISEEDLTKYLKGTFNLLNLIKTTEIVFCLDLDNEFKDTKTYLLWTEDIPLDYLPEEDSYLFNPQFGYTDKVFPYSAAIDYGDFIDQPCQILNIYEKDGSIFYDIEHPNGTKLKQIPEVNLNKK